MKDGRICILYLLRMFWVGQCLITVSKVFHGYSFIWCRRELRYALLLDKPKERGLILNPHTMYLPRRNSKRGICPPRTHSLRAE
jgi:hypothetical protein